MENPFKQTNNPKIESNEIPETEKLLKNTEKIAKDDFNNFQKSNNDFVGREKKRLGIAEYDPKIESEILTIKEKYKSERTKLKSYFLSKLKKIAKYTTGGIIALAFTTHFAQKEYPDYIEKSKQKEPKKIEWNEATKNEITKLSREYTLLIKQDATFKELPDSIFQNRFIDFVSEYGSDIEVVFIRVIT